MSTGTVSFTITGEFIYQTARKLYWLDDDHDRAYAILETLMGDEEVEGLTLQQTRALLDGEGVLDGDSNEGVEFAWAEDVEFKAKIQEMKAHRQKVKEKAEADARGEREWKSPWDTSEDFEPIEDNHWIQAAKKLGMSDDPEEEGTGILSLIEAKPEVSDAIAKREAIMEKWQGTPELNRLLKRYGNTVKVQRAGTRFLAQGGTLSSNEVLELADKDGARREIHEEIFNLFGFTHTGKDIYEPVEESARAMELSNELSDYLDACYQDSLL